MKSTLPYALMASWLIGWTVIPASTLAAPDDEGFDPTEAVVDDPDEAVVVERDEPRD